MYKEDIPSIPVFPYFLIKGYTAIKVNPVFSFIGLPECGPLLTTVSGYRNPVFVPFLCKRGYTCCFFLIIKNIHCYKSTFLLGLLGFRLENTLEWKMQRSPFILYSYYGTILIHIKLVI